MTLEQIRIFIAVAERGRLSIHASQTIASYWLPPRLARFHAAHPGIEIDVAIGNTAQVARAVAGGRSRDWTG